MIEINKFIQHKYKHSASCDIFNVRAQFSTKNSDIQDFALVD